MRTLVVVDVAIPARERGVSARYSGREGEGDGHSPGSEAKVRHLPGCKLKVLAKQTVSAGPKQMGNVARPARVSVHPPSPRA